MNLYAYISLKKRVLENYTGARRFFGASSGHVQPSFGMFSRNLGRHPVLLELFNSRFLPNLPFASDSRINHYLINFY